LHLDLESIFKIREKDSWQYFDFIDYFFSIVVGRRHYLKISHNKKLLQYATKSNEALVLLLFENSYNCWNDMYTQGTTKTSKIPPKYTNGGVSDGSKGRSRKYGGWSVEGLDRFDQLYRMVTVNRNNHYAEQFEADFMEYRLKDVLAKKEKKKGKAKSTDTAIEHRKTSVNNDLWSDDEANEDEEQDDASETSESVFSNLRLHQRASV
jgi:hypothetical protein